MSRIEEALKKAATRQGPSTETNASSYFARDADTLPPPTTAVDPAKFPEEKLVVLKTPSMPEAEEFRKLKEALLKEIRKHDDSNRVILISSAHKNEGKSLTTVNLAISLAQGYDHSVLIVDAELRMPTCHRYLNITPKYGLSDYLNSNNTIELSDVLIHTGIEKLVLLPAGNSVNNPLELLSSNTMRRLMDEMKQRYHDRIILIDSPPTLLFAETRALADFADGVLLVVREGHTSLEDIQECQRLLNNKIFGLVYNATEFVQTTPNYYYSSYYTE